MAEQVELVPRIQALLRPAFVLVPSIYYLLITILFEPGILFTQGLSAVRFAAFAKFWLVFGSEFAKDIAPQIVTLLGTVRGKVLDIGPGTGDIIRYFDANKVELCYGIEPAPALHERLKAAAKKAGFGADKGRYEVLQAGAQPTSLIPALAKAGVLAEGASSGIFDEIVCASSLCGVPTPVETCEGLYRLLKPGGRIVVYEHVLNKYDFLGRLSQAFFTLIGWKFWVGGCCLDRDTGKTLLDAGGENGWKEVNLEVLMAYGAIPRIVGYLVKAD